MQFRFPLLAIPRDPGGRDEDFVLLHVTVIRVGGQKRIPNSDFFIIRISSSAFWALSYQWGSVPTRRPITSRVSVTTTKAFGSRLRTMRFSLASSRKVMTV